MPYLAAPFGRGFFVSGGRAP